MKAKQNARKVRSRKKAIFELNVIIERIISVVTVEFTTKREDTNRVLQRINEIASERVQYGRIDYDKSTARHVELNRRDRKIAELKKAANHEERWGCKCSGATHFTRLMCPKCTPK